MEQPRKKTEEEIQIEREIAEIRESNSKIRENLKQAKEAWGAVSGDDDEDKKPFFSDRTKKNLKRGVTIATVAGAAAGGVFYGTKVGKHSNQGTADKIPENVPREVTVIEKSPATNAPAVNFTGNLSNEVARLKAQVVEELNKGKTDLSNKMAEVERQQAERQAKEKADRDAAQEKQKAEFEKELAQRRTDFSNEVVRIKKEITVVESKPVVQTHAELLEEIRKKNNRGEELTSEEQTVAYREVMRRSSERTTPTQTTTTPETAGQVYGGYIQTYHTPDEILNPQMREAPKDNDATIAQKKVQEKVEKVYEESLVKIFPEDTLKMWRSVKDRSAYELLSRPENRVPKAQKSLFAYLQKLKKETGLEPKSGVRGEIESIEKYIERALQQAALEGKLDQAKN